MAQTAVYFLLLISILPLLQGTHCPSRGYYCPVGLDCSKDKDLCEPMTCSDSPNGSSFCKKGISVSFSQYIYTVDEDDGMVQPVLILSEAMNCCNFHVRVNVRDITAKDTVDYDYTPRGSGQITVIIPAGRISVSFDVKILDDIIIEEDIESFQLSIVDASLPHDVSVGTIQSARVNIRDDDTACVDFERTTYSVRENDGSGSVLAAIILSRPTAIDIPISISTVDIDTSTVECDYEYGPYSVVFKNENRRSGTQRATFRVPIIDDDVYEENERFNLVLNFPAHNRISRCYPYRSTVTIQNDESLTNAYFDKTSITVDEDIGTISPILKLDKPSPCCITVLVELKDQTATGRGKDYDYKPPPRFYEYTFSAGDTCATPDRPIPIVDDKDSDENERFEIHVVDDSIPYGVKIRGRDYVTVTIKDNDINLCFDRNEFIVDENEAEVKIIMSIDERTSKDFNVTITDTSINADRYYSHGPYNFTIKKNHYPSRKIELTIPINAKDTMQRCTGNKIFNLTIECLSSPEGVTPCPDRGTTKVIIQDHESGSISFVREHYEIKKNQVLPTKPQLRFRGRPPFRAVANINDRQIMNDTGYATGGEDYKVRNYMETFTLIKSEREKTVDLTLFPFDDNIVEDDESYYLDIETDADGHLASYPCISVGIGTAEITILNDDRVLVKIDKYSQNGQVREDLVFSRGLKFETRVDIIYEGRSNETNHVVPEVSPFSGNTTPDPIPLDPDYSKKIYLTIHPAVFEYFDIQDTAKIIPLKKA